MNDLVTWLRAQLDEEAERAKRGQWIAQFVSQSGRRDIGSTRAHSKAIEREGGFSPSRVLAEVEAKRRILDWLDDAQDRATMGDYFGLYTDEAVKLLALPYADQPGYREEWRS